MTKKLLVAASLAATLCGPVASHASAAPGARGRAPAQDARRNAAAPPHVIVMVQENRTVDNLFQGYCAAASQCADTQAWGLDSNGNHVTLQPEGFEAQFDPNHTHGAFVTEYDNGKMDGFNVEPVYCFKNAQNCKPTLYAYVPQSETVGYWQLAQQFALADHVLQPNEGPSFPGHQYLIAGQSGYPMAFSENPAPTVGTCAAKSSATPRIDMTSPYPGIEGSPAPACADYLTIFDRLDAAGVSWKYYVPNRYGIWTAPLSIAHIYNSSDNQKVVTPEVAILSDIHNHQLPQVSYVIPRAIFSDHPWGGAKGNGPDWVGTVANAIGTDPFYWANTTLIVVWDDWGGWYDHFVPQHPFPTDPYEYGFRVPMIVVSAFVKPHQVDHLVRSSAAVLSFIETAFALPSLQTLDAKTDDLHAMFDYTQTPNVYTPVNTHGFTPYVLRRLPPDNAPVDW